LQESKIAVNPRYLFLVIAKAQSGAHWPRLLKAEGRAPKSVKVDWDKWKDEDDEDAERNGAAPAVFAVARGSLRRKCC
jgi:prostaglandin-E synthase